MNVKMLLLIVVLSTLGACMAFGQDVATVDNGKVKLELSSKRVCYGANSTVLLLATFTNTTDMAVYFYQIGNSKHIDGLEIFLYDGQGKLIGGRDPEPHKGWKEVSKNEFVRVDPGKAISRKIPLFLPENKGVTKSIFLRAHYRSTVSRNMIPTDLSSQKIWTLGDDDLFSEKLELKVSDNCDS